MNKVVTKEANNQTNQIMREDNKLLLIIEKLAVAQEVDVEKLERLMNLYEKSLHQQAREAFYRAFTQMQGEMPQIVERGKVKVNGVVRTQYALFEDIMEAITPVLNKYQFAILFDQLFENNEIKVICTISHASGYSESTTIQLPYDSSGSKNSVQAVGSSVSYGKRYALCSLLNITTRGEDDDGYLAATEIIDETQLETLQQLIKDTGADKEKFKRHFGIDALSKFPKKEYENAIAALKRKQGETDAAA